LSKIQGGAVGGVGRAAAQGGAPRATRLPHGERASGKMNLPIRLFSFVSHTFPLARMCLRALSPRVHSPLSLEGFSHLSKCACCGAIACFPFSSLAALAPSFYCEHCLFLILFFAKRKAEVLRGVEEGEGNRAPRGGCRVEADQRRER
jgi:hypothetical protein